MRATKHISAFVPRDQIDALCLFHHSAEFILAYLAIEGRRCEIFGEIFRLYDSKMTEIESRKRTIDGHHNIHE